MKAETASTEPATPLQFEYLSGTPAFQPLLDAIWQDQTLAPEQAAVLARSVEEATAMNLGSSWTDEEQTAKLGANLAKLDYLWQQWVPEHYRASFADAIATYRQQESERYGKIALSLTRAAAALQRQHGDPDSDVVKALDAEVAAIERGEGRGMRRTDAVRKTLQPAASAGGKSDEAIWSAVRDALRSNEAGNDVTQGSASSGNRRIDAQLAAYRQQTGWSAAQQQDANMDRLASRLRDDWLGFTAGLRR